MDAVAFVELLDRRGRVRLRQPVAALPATIGRGYDNAVILDDRWASPLHARLLRDEAGRLVLEDAGSENGTFRAGRRGRVSRVEIAPGVLLRLGHTWIRVVDPAFPLPPTWKEGARAPGFGGWIESRPVALTLTAAAGLTLGWQTWLTHTDAGGGAYIAGAGLAALGFVAVWAGLWALAGRSTAPNGRFLGHLAVASAGIVAAAALTAGREYLEFLWPAAALPDAASWVGLGLVGTAVLAGHLGLNTSMPRRRLLAVGASVAFAIVAVLALSTPDDTAGDPGFSAVLKPLKSSVIPAEPADRFFSAVGELKAQVDSLAADTL